jgi:hypothetical protein
MKTKISVMISFFIGLSIGILLVDFWFGPMYVMTTLEVALNRGLTLNEVEDLNWKICEYLENNAPSQRSKVLYQSRDNGRDNAVYYIGKFGNDKNGKSSKEMVNKLIEEYISKIREKEDPSYRIDRRSY